MCMQVISIAGHSLMWEVDFTSSPSCWQAASGALMRL